jgi:hypothetical protein
MEKGDCLEGGTSRTGGQKEKEVEVDYVHFETTIMKPLKLF